MKPALLSLLLTIAMTLSVTGAQAQPETGAAGNAQGTPAQATTTDEAGERFRDRELRQFLEAQRAIHDIRNEYLARIDASDSDEQTRQLRDEARDNMVAAIRKTGLDIASYNAIATAYLNDPSMRERVNTLE